MLLRTHLAFGMLVILLFIQHVSYKFTFVCLALIATVIPDLDTPTSSWGRHMIFRPLQFFARHRGLLHSFTIAVFVSFILAFVWPIASLGFFAGYSFHLLLDSFTKEGVQFFWPFKYGSRGFIKTGGRIEDSIFVFLVLTDVFLVFFGAVTLMN
jgi:inner membrane protein